MIYWAHTAGKSGEWEANAEHLRNVSQLAGQFAEVFGCGEEAEFAGLFHDLGKYGHRFQQRLRGLETGVDHWTAGAWECLQKGKRLGVAAALCAQGHHIGLKEVNKTALGRLSPEVVASNPTAQKLSEDRHDLLIERFHADGLGVKLPTRSVLDWESIGKEPTAQMLAVRMLFSALVDADFLCTERHFDGETAFAERCDVPALTAEKCLASLERYIERIEAESSALALVKEMRQGLRLDCLGAAIEPTGLFTLTAPTGTGKTLSMLAFALRHALEHGLRRVVVVIPYLTILEQTVKEYRKALDGAFPTSVLDSAILEHHSLAGTRERNGDAPRSEEGERRRRILSENWNAPFVVTTNVQFLESLFANRPGPCRKLHALAKSVVLMDEVQTIPSRLAIPTLAALSTLCARFGSSVVMATATQPAFKHLEGSVQRQALAGWSPREMVCDTDALFEKAVRTRVEWPPFRDDHRSWEDVAADLNHENQALCIVNLKGHAVRLFEAIRESGGDGCFHLSTAMCPAHREKTLAEVRRRLDPKVNARCILISTQCVEAGVDVDFPAVFRAMGPLEAIAQAAGRCNRNGRRREGVVCVFRPELDGGRQYPNGSYGRAADVTEMLLAESNGKGLDIHKPHTFVRYFERFYDLSRPDDQHKKLQSAFERLDFEEVAREYRIIEEASLNVVVPHEPGKFAELAREIMNGRLTRDWIARARPYSVGVFRPARDAALYSWLEPVPLTYKEKAKDREMAEDWFLLRGEDGYDSSLGLRPPEGLACLEA